MGFKKFIGNRAFYKMVFLVAIPIIVQNGITNFVSLLDNIMVGQVGTEQMSGVGIANQLIFVFNLCIDVYKRQALRCRLCGRLSRRIP